MSEPSMTKRYGVVRYCQLRSLNYYVECLMKRIYAAEAHTIPEWDQMVIDLLAMPT